jgi:hypothetical protein
VRVIGRLNVDPLGGLQERQGDVAAFTWATTTKVKVKGRPQGVSERGCCLGGICTATSSESRSYPHASVDGC